MRSQTSSWCTAHNVVIVILVYCAVISYIIYDFYFTSTDLPHFSGEDGHYSEKNTILLNAVSNQQTDRQTTNNKGEVLNRGNEKSDIGSISTTAPTIAQSPFAGFSVNDKVYDNIKSYGAVENGKRYAVFGCTTPTRNDYTFAFYLPLSVLAWERVNYSSIVIIVGSKQEWMDSKVLKVVLENLESLGAVMIFIHSKPEHSTMLSQVTRLFVPVLVPWTQGDNEPYLTTADADIWPLSATLYDLMPGTKIVSSNSECCGNFNHKGQTYKMLPMCYIGMHFSTWSEVMGFELGHNFTSSKLIIDYLGDEFGDIVKQQVNKGENSGWYLDQHLVSIRIQQWVLKNSPNFIQYIRRNTGADRVDRSHWQPHSIVGKKDTHLILSSYKPGIWERLLPLMHQMFNQTIMSTAEKYRESFLQKWYELKGTK